MRRLDSIVSFHLAVIDKTIGTVRESAGPFASHHAATLYRDQLRRLYRDIPPSRGSLARNLADELDFLIIANNSHTPPVATGPLEDAA